MDDLNTIESKDLGPAEKLPSFGERLLAIFVEPKIVFDYIKHRTDFWYSFIGIFVLLAIGSALGLPYSNKMQAMIAELTNKPVPAIDAIAYAKAVASVILLFLLIFVMRAFLMWLVVTLTAGGTSFIKALNVTSWSAYPFALATLVNAVVLVATQPEVTSLQTAMKEISPVLHFTSAAALAPESSLYLSMSLAIVSLFTAWQYWLNAIGIRRSLGGNTAAVVVFLVVLFILQVGWQLLQAFGFSKMIGA